MKKELVIACETLRDELLFVLKKTDKDLPVIWIEAGLHNSVKKLHDRLQEALDGASLYERVFLLLGTCGNAVLGLAAGDFELILPRVDDCISLLMGSSACRTAFGMKHAAYYLTQGWLRGERNIWSEYLSIVDKYGEDMAGEIAQALYGNYKTLALLDTGVEPVKKLSQKTKIIADTFGLEQVVAPATTSYIEELLSGPWTDARYIIKAAHTKILCNDLSLP
jgi:hypothetical protein